MLPTLKTSEEPIISGQQKIKSAKSPVQQKFSKETENTSHSAEAFSNSTQPTTPTSVHSRSSSTAHGRQWSTRNPPSTGGTATFRALNLCESPAKIPSVY